MRTAQGAFLALALFVSGCSPPDVPPTVPETGGEPDASQPLITHSARQVDGGIFIGTKDSERFGIMLPKGYPMPGLQQQEDPEMSANVYMSKLSDDRVALFGWNVYSKPISNEEYFLEYTVEQAIRQMEGRSTEYNRMRMEDWMGSQVWIASGSGESGKVARYEYWLIPPYLFQIGFMTPDPKELESAEVDAFFKSFVFGGVSAESAVVQPAKIPIIF